MAIAGNKITTAKIAGDAVTNAKIADDAIDSEHYTDGSIDNAHIADDAIDSEHYADTSIDTAHIADNQVTPAKLSDIARGSLIIGNASANTAELTKGGANTYLKSDGTDIAWASVSAGTSTASYNGIINGDFLVWQRGTSFTSGDNDDDSYTADRWIVLSDTNDVVDVTRQAGDTDTSIYSIGLDVETANKKFGIIQIIENKNCGGLGDLPTSTVSLSFKARVSSTTKLDNVKAGVLAWSGTADSVTSDVVSAWAVEGTNPTLATNWTYENTPANLSVTTSWVRYKIENISVDTAGTGNVAVFIWSDVTDTSTGDSLFITDVQLEPGATANDYRRDHVGTTMANCQRYYVAETLTPLTAYGTTGVLFGMCAFPQEMRATPTVSMQYNGTSNNIYTLHDAAQNTVSWAAIIGTTARGMGHGYGWTPSNWSDGVGVGHQTNITLEAEL